MRTRVIQSIDELIYFLKTHWNSVTDEQYKLMMWEAFRAYSFGKPKNKTKALKIIKAQNELIKSMPNTNERRLFIQLEIV
jgi:hypothetical protein